MQNVEMGRLYTENEELKRLLQLCKPYVKQCASIAQGLHDDPDGAYYMDLLQYDTVKETEDLLNQMNKFLDSKTCLRCGKKLINGRGGCKGSQHGNFGCLLNNPYAD